MAQTYTSANTSGNFGTPALFNNKLAISFMTGSYVLDIGCGKYQSAKKRCEEYAKSYTGYDKYNLSESDNKKALSRYYDVATLSNVLNVIDSHEERMKVINLACECADIVIITVYQGDKSGIGRQTKKDCFQMNQPISFYLKEIEAHFPLSLFYADSKIIVLKGGFPF